MLYWLLYPLHTECFIFNLFRYITFRAAYAGITALVLSFILGPKLVRYLTKHKLFANTKENGPPSQKSKDQTPVMGGILIICTSVISTLLWTNLNPSADGQFIWIALFSLLSLGGLGLWDDFKKVKKGKGLRPAYKFLWQVLIGLCIAGYVFLFPRNPEFKAQTSFLFFKNIFLYFGGFYIPFVVLVIVSTSNATNLADGLDGLAIGLIAEVALTYAILAYVVGNMKASNYLNILYISGGGELAIFLASIVGSALGFLWFNAHPAQMFMGDTGALALGGAIGTVAVLIKQEILLILAGGVFVIEGISVIAQVLYFKASKGKRIFRKAPLHHHYEECNIPENKIVIRFWIIGILFLLATLSTLKIR
ncbi:phospho-N-acetylmuramoyl-pentapeptide-transferase [candidate division WOR-3 bacterium]|nr:phospho-N-acetylmuramoyl-pentapeptide-transferase [candidate division WOR-3 bacterium]